MTVCEHLFGFIFFKMTDAVEISPITNKEPAITTLILKGKNTIRL